MAEVVETLAQTCVEVVREGFDKIVALGYPKQPTAISCWVTSAFRWQCCLGK